jgi:hypothetical protein
MGIGKVIDVVELIEQKYLDTRNGEKYYVNLVEVTNINKPFVVFIQKGNKCEDGMRMETTFATFDFATLADATELYNSIDDFKGCGA